MIQSSARIAIVGCPGAGKSTLARALSQTLGLPISHLDTLFWNKGWIETPDDEFESRIRAAVASNRWIIDGNFLRFQHLILPFADAIIWLDLPRRVCLRRIIWRWFCWRGRTRPDLPDGCPEKLDAEFVAWVWNFPRDQRPTLIGKLSELRADQHLITLHSAREVMQFMRDAGLVKSVEAPQRAMTVAPDRR